jgi:hypothetical protein
MQDLMTGMFWGGVVMAATPVAVGVAICIMLIKHDRATKTATEGRDPGSD